MNLVELIECWDEEKEDEDQEEYMQEKMMKNTWKEKMINTNEMNHVDKSDPGDG